MKRAGSSLDSFGFRNKQVLISQSSSDENTLERTHTVNNQADPVPIHNDPENPMIIGFYINKKVEDSMKIKLLKNKSKPPLNFQMPYTTRLSHGKDEKRSLRLEHFERFPWLTYSEKESGVFCKVCVLFNRTQGGPCAVVYLSKCICEPGRRFECIRHKKQTPY